MLSRHSSTYQYLKRPFQGMHHRVLKCACTCFRLLACRGQNSYVIPTPEFMLLTTCLCPYRPLLYGLLTPDTENNSARAQQKLNERFSSHLDKGPFH